MSHGLIILRTEESKDASRLKNVLTMKHTYHKFLAKVKKYSIKFDVISLLCFVIETEIINNIAIKYLITDFPIMTRTRQIPAYVLQMNLKCPHDHKFITIM